MSFFKTSTISGLVVSGIGGGLLITNHSTGETIQSKWSNVKFLKTDSSKGWEELTKKLKTDLEAQNGKVKSSVFAGIGNISKDNLKNACRNNLQTKYKNFFGEKEGLVNDYKNYCSITFKELISEEKILKKDSSLNSKVSEKWESLKKHKNKNSNFELSSEFSSLLASDNSASDTSQNDNNSEKLLGLCEKKYSEYFEGDDDNNWKSMEKYCSIN